MNNAFGGIYFNFPDKFYSCELFKHLLFKVKVSTVHTYFDCSEGTLMRKLNEFEDFFSALYVSIIYVKIDWLEITVGSLWLKRGPKALFKIFSFLIFLIEF